MKDEHIIDILDSAPLQNLSAEQLELVRSHCSVCAECGEALRAATVSSVMVRNRAQTVVEPTPFFQTRVMAALRERQAAETIPALTRLWKSAGALVSSMAVTTAALAALSFMYPATTTPPVAEQAVAYSAESVLLDQGNDEQMTYEQVLNAIYADEFEAK